MKQEDKDKQQKNVYNQMAWILNYQPKIEHQHIHMGNHSEKENDNQKNYDAEDAEMAEEVQANNQSDIEQPHDNLSSLSASRQTILGQLLDLTDKGDWIKDYIGEQVKAMMKTVLGQGDTLLKDNEAELSKKLWKLLENGRGDRVAIVWQNIVGYLDEKGLFYLKGSPALNKDFFGNEKNYSNIDKGRPRNQDNGMSSGFREILPLLDAYVPRVDKKA
ncbi:MAG: hypothetical protein J6X23_07860 [Bacteroidaceae bacterium]|nr:hypothetical protein [Bacteroidaceae bacterium]